MTTAYAINKRLSDQLKNVRGWKPGDKDVFQEGGFEGEHVWPNMPVSDRPASIRRTTRGQTARGE